MKKLATLFLAFAALPACAKQEPLFAGILLGASFGGTIAQYQTTQTYNVLQDTTSLYSQPLNTNLFANSPTGMLSVGYNYQWPNHFLLGGIFTASYTDAKVDDQITLSARTLGSVGLYDFESELKQQVTNDFALLVKPGYVLGRNTLFYGLLGARWGNIKSTSSYNFHVEFSNDNFTLTNSATSSEYKLGLSLGLGIQQLLAPRYSWALEYFYTIYGNLNSPNLNDAYPFRTIIFNINKETQSKLTTNTLMFTLSYRIWE